MFCYTNHEILLFLEAYERQKKLERGFNGFD